MKENVDYQLIPAGDDDQAWLIRFLTGEFVETVIQFGNIEIDGKNDQLKFNFIIHNTANDELTVNNPELQKLAADVLYDIIEHSINDGSLQLEEK
jgi:hypothetical protein